MTKSKYIQTKLNIFEAEANNDISVQQRQELLGFLEEKKNASELTEPQIKEFFEELGEKYPDAAEDIEKLQKKLFKKEEKEDKDDDKDDETPDEDESEDPDKAVEESTEPESTEEEGTSSMFEEFVNMIDSI